MSWRLPKPLQLNSEYNPAPADGSDSGIGVVSRSGMWRLGRGRGKLDMKR